MEAFVPMWNKDRSNLFACQSKNCIQCNQCAYICPHAAIRPFVLTDDELAGFDGLETLEMKAPAAMKGMHFVIEPSVLDCLGCGRSNLFACQSKNCADICPGNPKTGKALTMAPFNPDAADMKQVSSQRLPSVSGRISCCPIGTSSNRYFIKKENNSPDIASVRKKMITFAPCFV